MRWFGRWMPALLLVLAACAKGEPDFFEGVLHPGDSGMREQDSAAPTHDAGVDANTEPQDAGYDAGYDAGPIDAGYDAGEQSPVDGTATTNMPNAVAMYGGPQPSPGLTIVASHIELEEIGSDLSIEFYAKVRSDWSDVLCSFALDIRLLNDVGSELLALNPQIDQNIYDGLSGRNDCAGPGEEFYIYGSDFISFGAGSITTENIAVIEWTYGLGGSLYTILPSNDATATNLQVVPGLFDDTYLLTGTINNVGSTALGFPSIAAYVLSRGGEPLKRLVDISTSPLPRFGSVDFETGWYDYPFTPLDVDYRLSYIDP